MFSLVKLFTAALAITSVAIAAVTPQQAVENIRSLTTKSQALLAPAQSITLLNGILLSIGQGPYPQIITGFVDIVSTATASIQQMQGTPIIAKPVDAQAVADAFREFVRVHQNLLNILIAKAGLFSTVPFIGQPVAAVLRQIEGVVDTIAFGLIDIIPSQSSNLSGQQQSLDGTITVAINSYDGIQIS